MTIDKLRERQDAMEHDGDQDDHVLDTLSTLGVRDIQTQHSVSDAHGAG